MAVLARLVDRSLVENAAAEAAVGRLDIAATDSLFTVPATDSLRGLLGAAIIGAAVAAVLISNHYDDRSLGARVDATVVAAGRGKALATTMPRPLS